MNGRHRNRVLGQKSAAMQQHLVMRGCDATGPRSRVMPNGGHVRALAASQQIAEKASAARATAGRILMHRRTGAERPQLPPIGRSRQLRGNAR